MIRRPDYLESSFQGYRLIDGQFREIPPINGQLRCLTLGVDLSVHDQALQIVDVETGAVQLTAAEFEQAARLDAEQGRERERRAKEREQAARVAAEGRVRELEDELRRLKDKQS